MTVRRKKEVRNNRKKLLKKEKKNSLMKKLDKQGMTKKKIPFILNGRNKFLVSISFTSKVLSLFTVNLKSFFLSSQ